MAQSQVSGMSHQRGLRSSAVRHQAPTVMASRTKLIACGRSVIPSPAATTATNAASRLGTVPDTRRVLQSVTLRSKSIDTHRSQAIAGRPATAYSFSATIEGSHSVGTKGRTGYGAHGSGRPKRPPSRRNWPTRRCSQGLGSLTARRPTLVVAATITRARAQGSQGTLWSVSHLGCLRPKRGATRSLWMAAWGGTRSVFDTIASLVRRIASQVQTSSIRTGREGPSGSAYARNERFQGFCGHMCFP